jgi:hypothetical protein
LPVVQVERVEADASVAPVRAHTAAHTLPKVPADLQKFMTYPQGYALTTLRLWI